jgi:hypothetical protein
MRLDYLGLQEAEERVHTGELIVRQAEENCELASGRYNAGSSATPSSWPTRKSPWSTPGPVISRPFTTTG